MSLTIFCIRLSRTSTGLATRRKTVLGTVIIGLMPLILANWVWLNSLMVEDRTESRGIIERIVGYSVPTPFGSVTIMNVVYVGEVAASVVFFLNGRLADAGVAALALGATRLWDLWRKKGKTS